MRDQLVDVLSEARRTGNPMAGDDPATWERLANVAERRWKSYVRRQRGRPSTRAARIEDLAVGLRAICGDPIFIGPLMTDLRMIATQLAAALDPIPGDQASP